MKKFLFAISIALLLSDSSFAQTITKSVEWDTIDSVALTTTYINTLKIDSDDPVVLTVTCAVVGSQTHCKSNPIQLKPGSHIAVLTVTDPSGATGSASLKYNPPANPTNFVITINITIP